eukprot:m.52177 g.52177  ORF g.52177 m.52177 type:complete len:786 (+) comp16500_c0_seq1:327-2684(+)
MKGPTAAQPTLVVVVVAVGCIGFASAANVTAEDSPCDGIALGYWGDDSDKQNYGLFIAYGLVMGYIFGGVAVAADAFMGSIEAITAETTLVTIGSGSVSRDVEVGVWNKTVSNLSLMALGSSAPEILLAIIEVIGNDFEAGDLGPGTIVGSAAFNMLMIIAICVSIKPVKRVESIIVLYITAAASVFAYFWLYLMVDVISPKEIEIWEAAVTCAMFPLLLVVAWCADKGWFDGDYVNHKARKLVGAGTERHDKAAMKHLVSVGHVPVHATGTSEWNTELRRAIRRINKQEPELTTEQVYVKAFEHVKAHDHAPVLQGEIALTRSLTMDAADKANKSLQVSMAGAASPRPSTDSSSNLLKTEPEPESRDGLSALGVVPGAIEIVPVMRSQSSTSSLNGGTAIHKVGFPQALYKCIEQDGKIFVPVKRRGNLRHPLTIGFRERDSTALYGRDYSFEAKDKVKVLEFKAGDAIQEIEVHIVNHEDYHPNHHFFIELFLLPSAEASDFKWTNVSTKIRIIDEHKWTGVGECLGGFWRTLTSAEPAESPYLEQIRCAIRGDEGDDDGDDAEEDDAGDVVVEDDEGSSCFDWFVYLYLVGPALLLAIFSIPVTKWHGWGAFATSLMWIGIWTLLAGDLATGMGCTVGLADTVTAVTFVALGTSVPDTFASKIAAENDPTADPAIGNVTGSNAVNVFLGVGLSWLLGSVYQRVANDSKFVVESGALAFSVVLFTIFAVIWFVVLTIRRYTVGGELGGSGFAKWATIGLFATMWFIFILMVAFVEYGTIENPI